MAYPSSSGRGTYDNERLLQWRMDPRDSYSDVTLVVISPTAIDDDGGNDDDNEITATTTTTTTTYNLHKSFLAAGPRRCDFFIGLLRQHQNFVEGNFGGNTNNNNNSVVLPIKIHHQLAFTTFPIMLDYVYGGSSAIQITAQTAIPLYILADYYGVQGGLKQVAETYWRTDINNKTTIDNVAKYYEHYQVFGGYGYDEIRQAIIDACVDNLQSIIMADPTAKVVSSIIQVTDSQFWIDVFDSYLIDHPDLCNGKTNCSQLPCEFIRILCRTYYIMNTNSNNTSTTDKITSQQFQLLTSRKYLPRICCYSHAFGFLNIEYSIVGNGSKSSASSPSSRMEYELTCLQRRCLTTLISDWESMILEEDEDLSIELLHNQHPLLLARFAVDTLQHAHDESKLRSTKLQFAHDHAVTRINSLKRELEREKNRADTYEREMNKRLKKEEESDDNNKKKRSSFSSWWPTW